MTFATTLRLQARDAAGLADQPVDTSSAMPRTVVLSIVETLLTPLRAFGRLIDARIHREGPEQAAGHFVVNVMPDGYMGEAFTFVNDMHKTTTCKRSP